MLNYTRVSLSFEFMEVMSAPCGNHRVDWHVTESSGLEWYDSCLVFFNTFVLPSSDVWGHFGLYWGDIKHKRLWYTSWTCVKGDDTSCFVWSWMPTVYYAPSGSLTSLQFRQITGIRWVDVLSYHVFVSFGLRSLHQCFSTSITRSICGTWR